MIPSICDGRPFYDRFHLLPKFYATSEMFEQVENLRNFDGGRIDVDVFFNILYDKCWYEDHNFELIVASGAVAIRPTIFKMVEMVWKDYKVLVSEGHINYDPSK